MTTEKRRALLMMGATFVIGIVIGVLATGIFARQFYHSRGGHRPEGKDMREGRHGSMTDRIFKTVNADSAQRELMKPIVYQTMTRIDSLEEKSYKEAHVEMDSLKIKLRPILRTEQMEQLEKFLSFKRRPPEDKNKHGRYRN